MNQISDSNTKQQCKKAENELITDIDPRYSSYPSSLSLFALRSTALSSSVRQFHPSTSSSSSSSHFSSSSSIFFVFFGAGGFGGGGGGSFRFGCRGAIRDNALRVDRDSGDA